MFIPCPHCGFLVALIVSRPDAAQRCPRCHQPLQLSADDSDDAAAAAAAVATDADTVTGARDIGVDETGAAIEPVSTDTDRITATTTAPTPHGRRHRKRSDPHRASSAPSFARRGVSMLHLGPRWPGAAALMVLTVLLGLQLLLAQRHTLAADARWRPALAALCNVIGCELRPWREPHAFTMLARNVRPAPQHPGVLLVEASFRNDARWPQPWPRLLLRLSDGRGHALGQRLVAPVEYRGSTLAPTKLAPGQSASVRFAVREPAPDVVAFDFDFR